MSKELVIGSNRHETKVAVVEDDQLTEIYFQRANEYSLAGSIHKGRVTRVLPGMQSAFVDLGLERDTFLYVSDFFEEHEDIDTVSEDNKGSSNSNRRDRGGNRNQERNAERATPLIVSELAPPPVVIPVIVEGTGQPAVSNPSSAGTPAEASGAKAGERQEGERGGFRGGERRGRRSRRRRSRGHGFPENKYAQPGGHSPESGDRETPVSALETVDEEEDLEERDVIILPGESLAKYRNVTPESGREAESAEPVHDAAAIDEAEEEDETTSDEQEEIEKRAEELELADKVLAHHPEDEPEEVEEEKFAAAEADSPAPPSVQGVPADEHEVHEPGDSEVIEFREVELRSEPPIEALRHPVVYVMDEQEELESGQPSLTVREHIDEPVSPSRSIIEFPGETPEKEDDEAEGVGLSAGERAEDEVALDQAEVEEDFEGADLDDVHGVSAHHLEAEGDAEKSLEETHPAEQPSGGSPREGDYPQRSSRRMRRRRGGHRFAQQGGGDNQAAAASGSQSGAGSAVALQPESHRESAEERPERVLPSIAELLKPGQEIIVQIAKEPLGQKGARITSHVALPGRYVVFMPSVSHLGVSRKIASDEERQRLKRILQAHRPGTTGGFIVRTAGEGIPEADIASDMEFLYKLWLDIRQKAEKKPAPALLHYDLDIVQRILRDQVSEDYKAIWVDSEEMYENVVSFTQRFQPALVSRVKMYTRQAPVFDAFGITQELEKALRPKVWLKSGGYIVINQTEALVAIDINTGKYVGKSNRLEDTIVKTNIEAVKEIVRQIRLRDLGGIIVVDFIDMDERKNRQRVMQALEEAMEADKAPYKILQFNDFGLVAITRKRVKQSLERTLCAPCPYCEGAGYVKSVQTIISEILVEAQKIARAIEGKDVLLRVHPDVAKVLKANDNRYLEELEEILGRPVLVKSDPTLHHEKFDLG